MSNKGRDIVLFLEDILLAVNKIEKYTVGLSLDTLAGNDIVIDAVVRNFEIIGEAVKHLPGTLKEKHSDVEWKEAAGFRDILIHDYFGIDLEAVWDTIRNNIPPFKKKISRVLESELSNTGNVKD
jgi:uncharacterized protein with HEPN domain